MAQDSCRGTLHFDGDVVDGSCKSAFPCPSDLKKRWLQGALIAENKADLVIPECHSRTLWIGFSTIDAGLKALLL